MTKNPNAAVAAGGSSLSVIVVWLLGRFHVALSAEDGAIVAGVVASVALFVGRNGLRGVWRRLVDGSGDQKGFTLLEALIVLIIVAVFLIVWFGR
jgi:prepilin-type N-terminal cleavage/methylation domain-containing protein